MMLLAEGKDDEKVKQAFVRCLEKKTRVSREDGSEDRGKKIP